MSRIEFHPAANFDAHEAVMWYQKRSRRAAGGFERALSNAIKRISADPMSFPLLDGVHRFCILKKYPYYVVFWLIADAIIVVAVAPTHRADYWHERE